MMIAGRPTRAITFAIVYVLPEPVTPSNVWYESPSSMPSVSLAIACAWSPAGSNDWYRTYKLPGKEILLGVRVASGAIASVAVVIDRLVLNQPWIVPYRRE